MKKIFFLAIVWLFVLYTVNLVSSRIIFDSTSYELPKHISVTPRHVFVPWLNFDGRNYLDIVLYGYNHQGKLDLRVFFPLYPVIVRVLSLNLFLSPVLVGLAVSLFSFAGSLFVFNWLMERDHAAKEDRFKALMLLLFAPAGYYFFAFYTESLFLLLALLTFYFLKKRNMLLSSVFTALATATRITGLALLPAVLYEAYLDYKKTKRIPYSILLAPFGLLFYGAYLQAISGNALSFIQSQKNWNRPVGLLGPFYALKEGFLHFLFGSALGQQNLRVHLIEQLEFITALTLIAFLVVTFKKIRFSYWLYVFSSAAIILFGGILSSVPRYVVVLFPVYMFIAARLPKKYFTAVCVIAAVLSVILSAMFLRGYWVA